MRAGVVESWENKIEKETKTGQKRNNMLILMWSLKKHSFQYNLHYIVLKLFVSNKANSKNLS